MTNNPPFSSAPWLPQCEIQQRPIGGLRSKLLCERYGMHENPFGVTPNARYLYQSTTHLEAGSSLIIGVECGVGFQALIARPGMGKTTILLNLRQRFEEVARIAFLFQDHGNSHDFLRYLLAELGEETQESDRVHLQEAINRLLLREFCAGRQTIIIIDEAQNLSVPVLETVRQLSNFETSSEKLVQIILAGQPALAQKLASHDMKQLHQRIPILRTLLPFDLKDTADYIAHRLRVAGYQGVQLFTEDALCLIWKHSGGIPREINTLCFNALLLGKGAGQQIDARILQEALTDLDLDQLRYSPRKAGLGGAEVQVVSRPDKGPAPGIVSADAKLNVDGDAPEEFKGKAAVEPKSSNLPDQMAGTAFQPPDHNEEVEPTGNEAEQIFFVEEQPSHEERPSDVEDPFRPIRGTISFRWMRRWRTHKGKIYVLAATLILALAVLDLYGPASSQIFRQSSLALLDKLHLTRNWTRPAITPLGLGNPQTHVWIDTRTHLYYCPGADLYGNTYEGRMEEQRRAQLDRYEPASRKPCE
jgi:type II secretory pathway predicted ATPase ExeA